MPSFILSCLIVLGQAVDSRPHNDSVASPRSADKRAAYDVWRKQTPHDADAQVKLALWCEQNGFAVERAEHLARAVLADPTHLVARGLLGMVRDRDGKWVKADELAERVARDAKKAVALAEYNARRARLRDTADSHWSLAIWCAENDLPEEARVHLIWVTRLDPARSAAWKRLGYKRVGGQWVTDAQLEATKAENSAQTAANRQWRSQLQTWARQSRDPAKRAAIEAEMAAISDPRAVPSIWSLYVVGGSSRHGRAAQLLGQIDSRASSRALAAIAVQSDDRSAGQQAAEILKNRDPREYADVLIAMIRDAIRYEVRPVGGPGSPGALFIAGETANLQRVYAPPALPDLSGILATNVYYDGDGLPVWVVQTGRRDELASGRLSPSQAVAEFDRQVATAQEVSSQQGAVLRQVAAISPQTANVLRQQATGMSPSSTRAALVADVGRVQGARGVGPNGRPIGFLITREVDSFARVPVGQIILESQRSAAVAQQQLESDVANLENYNADVRSTNDRVVNLLQSVTGVALPAQREPWHAWYVNQLGMSYQSPVETPRPTILENVPLAYVPQPVPVVMTERFGAINFRSESFSCFAAGTIVHTRSGPRPIKEIQPGDVVLSLDTHTGELGYQPVLAIHHNAPSPTLRIGAGDEVIVATGFHRFWRAGRGWALARELKVGDALRSRSGLVTIDSIREDATQPVLNLTIAGSHTFFVGATGILAYDNSLPDLRSRPFDAVSGVQWGE